MPDFTATFQINQRQLIAELESATPVLVREARAALKEEYFDPAVKAMQEQFDNHEVTKEIEGGTGALDYSGALERNSDIPFDTKKKDRNMIANLWGFIGFHKGTNPISTLRAFFDPNNDNGPKMVYRGRDKDSLTFRFEVSQPNWDAIQKATPLPWADGNISWAKRIEQGLPGLGHFLNAKRAASESGGGIQVGPQLRGGGFRPTSYLSAIFSTFLKRVSGKGV